MIKRFYFLLLGLSFVLSAHADELDEVNRLLEDQLNALKGNYANVLTAQFDYDVDKQFSLAANDHILTALQLRALRQKDTASLQQVSVEFEEVRFELTSMNAPVDSTAGRLLELQTRLSALKRNVSFYEQDLSVLEESWENYCSEKRLQDMETFYNPLSLFSVDDNLASLGAPKTPFQFSMGVGFNYGEGGISGGTVTPPPNGTDEDMAWYVGATVAAAVVAKYGCATGVLCVKAIIAAVIVFAVKLVIDLVSFTGEQIEKAEKLQRQRDLRDQINDLQSSTIKNLANNSLGKVKTACDKHFSESRLWPHEEMGLHRQDIQATEDRVAQFIAEELDDLRERYYDYLINQYLPGLLSNYLESIESYYAQRALVDTDVVNFTEQNIVPLLEQKAQRDLTYSETEQTRLEQQVWSQVIIGDALYAEKDQWSFFSSGTGETHFGNIWQQMGPLVLERVVQHAH